MTMADLYRAWFPSLRSCAVARHTGRTDLKNTRGVGGGHQDHFSFSCPLLFPFLLFLPYPSLPCFNRSSPLFPLLLSFSPPVRISLLFLPFSAVFTFLFPVPRFILQHHTSFMRLSAGIFTQTRRVSQTDDDICTHIPRVVSFIVGERPVCFLEGLVPHTV